MLEESGLSMAKALELPMREELGKSITSLSDSLNGLFESLNTAFKEASRTSTLVNTQEDKPDKPRSQICRDLSEMIVEVAELVVKIEAARERLDLP